MGNIAQHDKWLPNGWVPCTSYPTCEGNNAYPESSSSSSSQTHSHSHSHTQTLLHRHTQVSRNLYLLLLIYLADKFVSVNACCVPLRFRCAKCQCNVILLVRSARAHVDTLFNNCRMWIIFRLFAGFFFVFPYFVFLFVFYRLDAGCAKCKQKNKSIDINCTAHGWLWLVNDSIGKLTLLRRW